MWSSLVRIVVFIVTGTDGRVLVYNTENEETVEKFDCVYFVPNYGEEISYCRRTSGNESLHRHQKECDNEGKKELFLDLLKREIHPSLILQWSSSVEIVDSYARLFYNRSLMDQNDDRFVCNCRNSGTFGKSCEYQLTHNSKSFSEAITAQFEQKKNGDSWDTQRYGQILCYDTVPCRSSPLCLDWREICDGVQRCSNGSDEENWEKLEFNECEDDEFRCTNGMCIAEELWLDGEFDCMDWSDEYFRHFGHSCPYQPNAIECDEHLCISQMYSCGDGECVSWATRMPFQQGVRRDKDCSNKRNLNHMCETSAHPPAWTLSSGLCSSDEDYDDVRYPPWNTLNRSQLSDSEKCQYLLRCALSKGLEHHCPCNEQNCTQMLMGVCPEDESMIYPPPGVINPNILVVYEYSHPMQLPRIEYMAFSNSVKCRGYSFQVKDWIVSPPNLLFFTFPRTNEIICTLDDRYGDRDFSSAHQNDKFCWNGSLTFNGRPYAVNPHICLTVGECLSQYRIRDGSNDCRDQQDERTGFDKNFCSESVGRHRFQCFNDEQKCLSLMKLGTGQKDCSNNYDEGWYGMGNDIRMQLPCSGELKSDCQLVKSYIQQSSANKWTNHSQEQESTDRLPFREYCDSFWNLDKHLDEIPSSCSYWICQKNHYQCRTGQCIPEDWLCDGEWDCSDASDEQALFIIDKWSTHNIQLANFPSLIEKCRERYSRTPFSNICNTSFEFGCYRSSVSNPLDIESFRPCINLTQIGDGVEDCSNAYDEKNTFASTFDPNSMWGFQSHCGSADILYPNACDKSYNCSQPLCSHSRDNDGSCSDRKDFICLGNHTCKKQAWCDDNFDCANGEDEYWCAFGTVSNQITYRFDKKQTSRQRSDSPPQISYPRQRTVKTDQSIRPPTDESFKIHSYQCNRGIAVLQMNETRCLCPPAYYGRQCQFFSDRISIIARLDQKALNRTMKIRAHLLFKNRVIDHHEFDLIPQLERGKVIKHKFYLLYSRSPQMLVHKRERYFNRSDITNNHPYIVHFDAFAIEENTSVKEVGSWHYPIYFDYLPAFRLAVVLKLPSWLGNTTLDPCLANSCSNHSNCLPIFDENRAYYCSCQSGYYGRNCSMYEPLCETSCATNALCRVDQNDLQVKKNRVFCICPLNHFGSRCNLKLNECQSNPCFRNGTCLNTYDPSGANLYICLCSEQFGGSRCEKDKASLSIDVNMTETVPALATVVQLYHYHTRNFLLVIQEQQVSHGLPSSIRYYHFDTYLPSLGVLKIYEDFSRPRYFLLYFIFNAKKINVTSSPQHCPHVSLVLSEDVNRSVPSVFRYHRICRNENQTFCFHDENYFCICQNDHYRAECFISDVKHDHCAKCLSGGKCLQGDLKDWNDFICFCPSCHQGHRCEFSMEAFGFTLDSLLVEYSKEVKIIYGCIVAILFLLGLFNNFCSFLTFKRPTPRKFGVGNYLLIISCLNQMTLFCLLFKFVQITFGILSVRTCQVVPYFLSVLTRSTYWLTSSIAIDRLLMIIFPTSSMLKNTRVSIGISVSTLLILFAMHVHEIIYYTMIEDHGTDVSICVTNFDTKVISTYNRISTLIHYLCPFFIQVICITVMIVLAARSRAKTTANKMTFGQVLKKQFRTQKELYITPTIIILSALPQAIFTFSFACTPLSDWQRHILLISYLFSNIPQVLGFILHVMPATAYRKEFSETLIGKKLFKSMLDKTKTLPVVAKQNK